MSKAIDILLLGKSYRVACPEGQEHSLNQAVSELSARLDEAREKTTANNEHVAMMVALNLAYELLEEKQTNKANSEQMDERIRSLQETIEHALLENSSINR